MNTLSLDTEKLEQLANENSISVKKPRGRPAKYSPEEREQKYKEVKHKWIEEHKEICHSQTKEYYASHKETMNQQKKQYQDRSREALRILQDIWTSEDCIIPENIKIRVQHLFPKKTLVK